MDGRGRAEMSDRSICPSIQNVRGATKVAMLPTIAGMFSIVGGAEQASRRAGRGTSHRRHPLQPHFFITDIFRYLQITSRHVRQVKEKRQRDRAKLDSKGSNDNR